MDGNRGVLLLLEGTCEVAIRVEVHPGWHVRPYGHTKTLRFGRVSVVPQKRRSSEEILAQSAGFFECLLKRPKEECDTEMLREGPGVPDKLELSAFSGVAPPSTARRGVRLLLSGRISIAMGCCRGKW